MIRGCPVPKQRSVFSHDIRVTGMKEGSSEGHALPLSQVSLGSLCPSALECGSLWGCQ